VRLDETLKRVASLVVEFDPEPIKESKPWSVMDADAPAAAPAQRVSSPASSTSAPSRTVEQLVREAPGPNLDEIKPAATANVQVIDTAGAVNFVGIYKLANLPSSPFSAEQVLDLLAKLPAELPLDAKRATVNATVNAMAQATGVTSDAIVADASRKLAALAAYAKSYADQASQFITKADAEITALQAEIEQKKRSIDDAKDKQTQMVHACTAECDRLDEVLEFFSLDVHPSKYAGPATN
jgi:hypothetical protein